MITSFQIDFFHENGYVIIEDVLTAKQILYYQQVYEDFLTGKIADGHRSDLDASKKDDDKERITQIMRPSLLHNELLNAVLHKKTKLMARLLMGDDLQLDFDMLIDKQPFSNTPTPWHQDEAYWIDLPDKRAVSCWMALDNVVKENGCMWFMKKSHKKSLRKHQQIGSEGALQCKGTERGAMAAEMKAGSCTFHQGRTLHYSRGNNTKNRRRAFITNYRPEKMIALERAKVGYPSYRLPV